MRINNTQNSPDFRAKFFVVSEYKIDQIGSAVRFRMVRDGIANGCKALGIPCHYKTADVVLNHEGKQIYRMPFITGDIDVAKFKRSGKDEFAFIPQDSTLDLDACLQAINKNNFNFLDIM